MWPMLAGLGALLGEGRIGEFHSSRGVTGVWFHEAGVTGIEPTDRSPRVEIDRVSEAHQLDRHPPVAVLIDGGAGSSGEATAIAFIGHPQTRSFGMPTYGFTTANRKFPTWLSMICRVVPRRSKRGGVRRTGYRR